MTKKGIIWISVVLALLVLTGVLFGAVFCLRKQEVKNVGDGKLTVSNDAIIQTAGFKKGSSIFLLDKEKAINNIESVHPEIKVIQIKTVSLIRIEIVVRMRHEMFYTKIDQQYYVLDEELKVIDIRDDDDLLERPVSHLIQITNGLENISITSTKEGDFVGTEEQQQATKNLYVGMVTAVRKTVGEQLISYDREDVRNTIKEVKFETFNTFNKIVVTTSYGVKLDIENPQENMTHKVNVCFSSISQFIKDESNKEKSGTIKIYYDLEEKEHYVYIPDALPPAE